MRTPFDDSEPGPAARRPISGEPGEPSRSAEAPASEPTPFDPDGLPGFLLIGAMKSGTSSVHHLLAHHPDVFMPRGEVFFFDVDDFEQHPDFCLGRNGGWIQHDFERDLSTYLAWYRGLFRRARPGQLLGEDSTTYLASRLAPGRVARYLPEARLVVVLRDPVARAYSHHWHDVSRGRAVRGFEQTLRRQPGTYLSRGFYQDQLERWVALCGRERLRVIFFEDFRADPQGVFDDLCDFLGLNRALDVAQVSSHRNATRAPLHPPSRLLANRVLRRIAARRYDARVPNMPGYRAGSLRTEAFRHPAVDRLEDLLALVLPPRRAPPMAPDTRRFLEGVFRKRNRDLGALLDEDVAARWPYMARAE